MWGYGTLVGYTFESIVTGKISWFKSWVSVDDALEYEVLKDALPKRCQLNEEMFMSKLLRNSRTEVGDTTK